MTTVEETIAEANASLPDPPTSLRYEGVGLYEVEGPDGGHVVIAFGLLNFERMFTTVNAYMADRFGRENYIDLTTGESIVSNLERLIYARVDYVDEGHSPGQEGTFTIDWTQGLVPVTVWIL